jgi:hypothetical protein
MDSVACNYRVQKDLMCCATCFYSDIIEFNDEDGSTSLICMRAHDEVVHTGICDKFRKPSDGQTTKGE